MVLAYLPEDELRQFADALPEADVVVGGPTGQPVSPKPGRPHVAHLGHEQGKVSCPARRARRRVPPERWTGSIVELNGQFADDAQQTANLAGFRAELARRDFTPAQTDFAEPLPADLPKEFAVAGIAACRECHEEDYQLWRKSKHAAAWKSLGNAMPSPTRTVSAATRPVTACRAGSSRCGEGGGRADVGCESCHGPSQGHVANSAVRTAYFAQAKNRCPQCHDRENSPKFAYEKYWEQIDHGKPTGSEEPKDAIAEGPGSH